MARRGDLKTDLWAQIGFYASLGFIIPGGAVAGYIVGWLLDRWLHTGHALAIIMAFLGAAGGLVEVIQILLKAENRADRNNPDAGSGRGSGT